MIDLDQLSDLLTLIYGCAVDPAGWQDVAIQLAKTFGSERCLIHMRDTLSGSCDMLGMTGNLAAAGVSRYADHYFTQDVWAPGALRRGIGTVSISDDVVSDQDVLRTEFYQDFCRHLGIFHVAVAFLPIGQNFLGGIGIHRPHKDEAFEADDRTGLQLMLPHITRAIQLEHRLRDSLDKERIAFNALDALRCGVVVVEAGGRLLFANRTAEKMFRRGNGLIVRQRHVHASDADSDARLQRLVAAAAQALTGQGFGAGGLMAVPRSIGSPLSLLICPVPREAVDLARLGRPVIIFIDDPER